MYILEILTSVFSALIYFVKRIRRLEIREKHMMNSITVDEFTCDARPYGYYADVANECQIFHICYPVTYADGEEEMFKWSFICPNGTIFDQVCA